MSSLKNLQDHGQSVWLDSISREMLDDGVIERYSRDLSVTGLTSNPTIFEKAISGSDRYDADLRQGAAAGHDAEQLFFDVALSDITRAADLFRPVFDATGGVDGFASIEVSPTLADDAEATIAQGRELFERAGRPNVLIKVPGTRAGQVAIEELISAGVPINVTLLFSVEQYEGSAEAYLRGLERRAKAGQDLKVPSVASLFVSRWDGRTAEELPPELANQVGLAMARSSYAHYRALLASERWQELARGGALPQRLLMASTGTKDPSLPDGYYVTGLAAEGTVNTMPEKTLLAFAKDGELDGLLGPDAAPSDAVIEAVNNAGLDLDAIAAELLEKGKQSFVDSWNELLAGIEAKRASLS